MVLKVFISCKDCTCVSCRHSDSGSGQHIRCEQTRPTEQMPEAKRVCVLICGSAEGAEPKAKTDESLQRKTDLFFFHPVQTFRQYNAETYHFFPPPLKGFRLSGYILDV